MPRKLATIKEEQPLQEQVPQEQVPQEQVPQEQVPQEQVPQEQVPQEQPKEQPKEDTPKKRDKTIKLENAMQTLINNRTKLQKRQLSLEKQLESIKQQVKENEECIISTHLAIQEDNKNQ